MSAAVSICQCNDQRPVDPKLKTKIVMANGDVFVLEENFSEIVRFASYKGGKIVGYRFKWMPETGTFMIYKIEGEDSTEVAVATFWDGETDRALELDKKREASE